MADIPLVKSPVPLAELAGADVASDGEVPTSDGAGGVAWETPAGGGGSGVVTLHDSQTLGTAAANITFSSIPATASHIRIAFSIRTVLAATSDTLSWELNTDGTGANYDRQELRADGATVTAAFASNLGIGQITGASATANHFGDGTINIAGYALTDRRKTGRTEGTVPATAGSALRVYTMASTWKNTAAINSILLKSGAGSNLAAGSRADLYLID